MPRIIFKCPYIKPGTERAAAHLNNYVRYVATRDGTDLLKPDKAGQPATKKQRAMVERLLRDFPMCRGMFEYEDYQSSPTRATASEFITRAIEDNYDQIAKRENYVSYIAQRPRAERLGAHGLFNGTGTTLELSRIAEEVANHPGNVWLPIISLRREDADRLGYNNARQWQALLSNYAPQIADAMKIPWEQFRWYASYHDEGAHPHVHMVCYSTDGRSGFLDKEGIARIKSGLATSPTQRPLPVCWAESRGPSMPPPQSRRRSPGRNLHCPLPAGRCGGCTPTCSSTDSWTGTWSMPLSGLDCCMRAVRNSRTESITTPSSSVRMKTASRATPTSAASTASAKPSASTWKAAIPGAAFTTPGPAAASMSSKRPLT